MVLYFGRFAQNYKKINFKIIKKNMSKKNVCLTLKNVDQKSTLLWEY